jgi:2-dehydro-3-deoxygalactonokinase
MIGVDWGTSSFRAFRMDVGGRIAGRVEGPNGIMQVPDRDYAAVLRRQIGVWLSQGERCVLLSGMIGSRQGWVEAPYLACPAGAAELAASLVPVAFDDARVLLVPGLSHGDAAGTPEVMRGEEVQLVGVLPALGERGTACLPGSHSKWARITGGRIDGFSTYLSGETFAALRSGTILARTMSADAAVDHAAFDRGVARSADPGHLLHHLFGVRTLALFGRLSDAEGASYLSGLLIGHEVRDGLASAAQVPVQLIGARGLCCLYARAIEHCGGTATIMDEDAAATGLALIGQSLRERDAAWT